VDAVAFHLPKEEGQELYAYLHQWRPSLPIFETASTPDKLAECLDDLTAVLNRKQLDFSEEQYTEADIMAMLRITFAQQLLAGKIDDPEEILRQLKLLRSPMSRHKAVLLADLSLPQGEIYISGIWRYGQERLEVALRNFFREEIDEMIYTLVVLTPRHIRLLAVPKTLSAERADDALTEGTRAYIEDAIASIKEYLDLDIDLVNLQMLPDVTALSQPTFMGHE